MVRGNFEIWIELTSEWNAACSQHRAAREARTVDEGLDDQLSGKLHAAEDQAVQRLKYLKMEMDGVIERAARARSQVKSELAFGTLFTSGKIERQNEDPD